MTPEPTPHRRSADRVSAEVKLYVTDTATETRHVLRNEFAEAFVGLHREVAGIRSDIQVGNLADRGEFAQLQAMQAATAKEVADLRGDVDEMQEDVENLKAKSVATEAVTSLKRWVIAAVAVPSAGILATVLLYLAENHH